MSASLMCPSAQPDMADAVILGVRGGPTEAPFVSYLEQPVPVSSELLALSQPLLPTEVYRFAARCEEHACRHFDGRNCSLATRIVQILPAVVDAPPPCKIRHECRWFQQEGRPACMRCPQVITQVENAGEQFRLVAMPVPR
jgi:hypothetical protein